MRSRRPEPCVAAAERLPELRAVHPDAVVDPHPHASGFAARARVDPRRTRSSSCCAAGSSMLGPDDGASAGRRHSASLRPTSRRRCWRSRPRASCCAVVSHRESRESRRGHPPSTSSGATGRCSRGSTATRSTGCAPRSSRSAPPTSCASCSPGSTSSRRHTLTGAEGLRTIVSQLDGYRSSPRGAWERAVLPARMDRYDASMLDMICLAGEAGWGRLSAVVPNGVPTALVPATPVALFLREHAGAWYALRGSDGEPPLIGRRARGARATAVTRGASFFTDLAAACALRCRSTAPGDRPSGRVRSRHLRWIFRAACARLRAARGRPDRSTAAPHLPADGRPSKPSERRGARGRRPDTGVGAAASLRCRLPSDAGARDERGAMARARRASTGGSKREARFAAAGSCRGCRASSSRCLMPWSVCARFAACRR